MGGSAERPRRRPCGCPAPRVRLGTGSGGVRCPVLTPESSSSSSWWEVFGLVLIKPKAKSRPSPGEGLWEQAGVPPGQGRAGPSLQAEQAEIKLQTSPRGPLPRPPCHHPLCCLVLPTVAARALGGCPQAQVGQVGVFCPRWVSPLGLLTCGKSAPRAPARGWLRWPRWPPAAGRALRPLSLEASEEDDFSSSAHCLTVLPGNQTSSCPGTFVSQPPGDEYTSVVEFLRSDRSAGGVPCCVCSPAERAGGFTPDRGWLPFRRIWRFISTDWSDPEHGHSRSLAFQN